MLLRSPGNDLASYIYQKVVYIVITAVRSANPRRNTHLHMRNHYFWSRHECANSAPRIRMRVGELAERDGGTGF
jgi:hypothetical protein